MLRGMSWELDLMVMGTSILVGFLGFLLSLSLMVVRNHNQTVEAEKSKKMLIEKRIQAKNLCEKLQSTLTSLNICMLVCLYL